MVSEHASPLVSLGEVDTGGQNVHVDKLAAGLVRRGHEVVVHTRRDDPAVPAVVPAASGVQVEHVPAGPPERIGKDDLLPHMGAFAQHLHDRWASDPPDVVHAHFWMSGLASLIAAKDLGIPVVQTFHALGAVKRRHQGSADTSPPEREQVERLVARRASWVVATSSDEVLDLVRMGLPRSRVSVVPCGVDTEEFRPEGSVLPRTPGRQRLVVLSRLVPRKGIDTVISALAALPDVELLIAGGPPIRLPADPEVRRLADHARGCGVTDRVRLLGQVERDQVPALLRSADAVVCTPWYEPFGIVPLEAMACGVPVVATAVGGMTDTVVDRVTGRLVPPRRPDLLARTLRSVLADPALRAGYGAAGSDRARSRYTWDRVARDTLRVYQQCLPAALVRAAGAPQ
ncbi:MAG: glycosyltransferase [Actinobacteria bacterium]|nr:glycosyltransferase [Actinomycetota bacterium]